MILARPFVSNNQRYLYTIFLHDIYTRNYLSATLYIESLMARPIISYQTLQSHISIS